MSQVPIFKYPLDLTGSHPGNLVTYELVQLVNTSGNRTIVPKYGAFYAASMKIRQVGHNIDANALSNVDLTGIAPLVVPVPGDDPIILTDVPAVVQYVNLSNQLIPTENGLYTYVVDNGGAYTLTSVSPGSLLVPGTDYKSFMLNQDATRMSGGKFVDQLMVLTNQTIQGYLILEYQAVGGIFSVAADVLQLLIQELDLDNRPVNWHDLVELPPGFNPTPHYHHSSEYFGYGGLISAIERMYLAVVNLGDSTPILNRKIFPPILDYAGPVYVVDEADNESRTVEGSIFTYLGKILPRPQVIQDPYKVNAFKVKYMTIEYVNGNFETIEGELSISFGLTDADIFEVKDVITSGLGHSSSKFMFYISQVFDIGLNMNIISAIHLFELSSFNRAQLILNSDDLPDFVVFDTGENRVTIGVDADITFDTIVIPVSSNPPSQFVTDTAGEINTLVNMNDVFAQFMPLEENEEVLLSDIKDAFTLMIQSMNKTSQVLESKVNVVSEINFRPAVANV